MEINNSGAVQSSFALHSNEMSLDVVDHTNDQHSPNAPAPSAFSLDDDDRKSGVASVLFERFTPLVQVETKPTMTHNQFVTGTGGH